MQYFWNCSVSINDWNRHKGADPQLVEVLLDHLDALAGDIVPLPLVCLDNLGVKLLPLPVNRSHAWFKQADKDENKLICHSHKNTPYINLENYAHTNGVLSPLIK